MAWIPIYADKEDFRTILEWLNADPETVFIVASNPGRWVAKSSLDALESRRYCIWHLKSGPGLFQGGTEWEESASSADPDNLYFGPGETRVFWLDACPDASTPQGAIGLSNFGWAGNRVGASGKAAPAAAEAWWRRLGRWIRKSAIKIPRGGLQNQTAPEIWAFPSAHRAISAGTLCALNPTLR
jgi:hypothetical protein